MVEFKTFTKVLSHTKDECCKNCTYANTYAQAKGVLSCEQLHRGNITPDELEGQVCIGWYGKGMLFRGFVVTPTAVCASFSKKK